jgi:glycosyltransferase involved in cell wall biosynthesis
LHTPALVIELLRRAANIVPMHRHHDELQIDDLPASRRSLRVAVVTETYPPEVNGVAMSIGRVVDGLQARDHHVQLVRPRQGSTHEAQIGARLDEVLTRGWPIPMYACLRVGVPCKRSLVRQWSLQRPDVVHIATEGPLGWSALAAARHLALPVTSDYRTNFHAYGRHYKAGWLARPIMGYLRTFHNRTQCTMVPTEAMRAELAVRAFERLAVVSRGVDTALFAPQRRSAALREHWGAAAGDVVVMCVGRLAPEKNLGVALQAFDAISRVLPRARLVFVGEGPQRTELQARCPRAHFAGSRCAEDLAAHYASADLFLFPSLTETFGNVTTEAMASGLAVVAFDSAAAGQLIRSGHNGAVVAGGRSADFVQAALAAACAPQRRHNWGTAARETVRALDWRSVVVRFESVLLRAIETPDIVSAPASALRLQRRVA